MISISGGCLCEKVRYKISQPPISQGVCYCRQCQRSGGAYGGPLLVLYIVTFECSPEGLAFCTTRSDDGSTVMRNFCKECGSHVFSQITDLPEIITVKAATLDDFSLFAPEYLVWTRSAGPSCAFPARVPAFSEDAPLNIVLGRTRQP
ncbi:MAG: GFA family protein [Bdellovibrionota bacterium]